MIDSRTSLPGTHGRDGAVVLYALAALAWTAYLGWIVAAAGGRAWLGVVWGISAAALWFRSLREQHPSLARAAVSWWLRSLAAPVVVLVELLDTRGRLSLVEDEVARLKSEVHAPRHAARPAPGVPEREPEPPRVPAPKPIPAEPAPTARETPLPPPPEREPAFDWRDRLESADLLGAKALAWTGGVVTLLGVVFFFVLAANRGWIGPDIRIACGAAASAIVFGSGFWLRRRFGDTFASLAAVGAGIAGSYATLLAAASLYDMVSKPVALALAAGIAAGGLATSLV
jgi:hypothetical protein